MKVWVTMKVRMKEITRMKKWKMAKDINESMGDNEGKDERDNKDEEMENGKDHMIEEADDNDENEGKMEGENLGKPLSNNENGSHYVNRNDASYEENIMKDGSGEDYEDNIIQHQVDLENIMKDGSSEDHRDNDRAVTGTKEVSGTESAQITRKATVELSETNGVKVLPIGDVVKSNDIQDLANARKLPSITGIPEVLGTATQSTQSQNVMVNESGIIQTKTPGVPGDGMPQTQYQMAQEDYLSENPEEWSVTQTLAQLMKLDPQLCAQDLEELKRQRIDAFALVRLNVDTLMTYTKMKVGPVMRVLQIARILRDKIEKLKMMD